MDISLYVIVCEFLFYFNFDVTLFLYFIYWFNKILDFGSYVKEAMLCCSNPFHVILQSFFNGQQPVNNRT